MTQTKTDLSKYIVNIQGKDFITFPGLLAEGHAQGLKTIETNLVNSDLTNPVMKATVVMQDDKMFTGYGDASSTNVAKKVAGALIRMAETRAVARALRFACNIDMTALEELDANAESEHSVVNTQTKFSSRTDTKPDSAHLLDKAPKSEKVTAFKQLATPTESPTQTIVVQQSGDKVSQTVVDTSTPVSTTGFKYPQAAANAPANKERPRFSRSVNSSNST